MQKECGPAAQSNSQSSLGGSRADGALAAAMGRENYCRAASTVGVCEKLAWAEPNSLTRLHRFMSDGARGDSGQPLLFAAACGKRDLRRVAAGRTLLRCFAAHFHPLHQNNTTRSTSVPTPSRHAASHPHHPHHLHRGALANSLSAPPRDLASWVESSTLARSHAHVTPEAPDNLLPLSLCLTFPP